jgi:hypothetical protein
VDFIKQFTPYALGLRSAPIFLSKFTLIWHHAFEPCAQLFAFPPRFWVRFTLYALRPTFMKSTPGHRCSLKKVTYLQLKMKLRITQNWLAARSHFAVSKKCKLYTLYEAEGVHGRPQKIYHLVKSVFMHFYYQPLKISLLWSSKITEFVYLFCLLFMVLKFFSYKF